MAQYKYPKKITTATIGLDKKLLEELVEQTKGKSSPVMRVYGRLASSKQEISKQTDSPFFKYAGQFEAHNLVTDELFRSETLIVPPVAETALNSALSSVKKDDPNATSDFAIEIYIEKNTSLLGGVKYKYGVQSLMENKEPDSIALIGASLPKAKLLTVKSK